MSNEFVLQASAEAEKALAGFVTETHIDLRSIGLAGADAVAMLRQVVPVVLALERFRLECDTARSRKTLRDLERAAAELFHVAQLHAALPGLEG